jgi:alkylated DNA repair dioxygenase AlkB
MLAIKARVEAYCGTTFNFCFLNLYRNGEDKISWHSDDQKALIPDHEIAAVSFGSERDILFKNKATEEKIKVELAHGSLYVMRGATQNRYKHMIPKRPRCTTPRINLTFRQIRLAPVVPIAPAEALVAVEESVLVQ